MQRKSTLFSHPFHALFQSLAILCLIGLPVSGIGGALFHIECPPDVTVDCEAELWDLSIYGNATVYGYGDPQSAGPPISVDYNLNSCSVGTIVRTWVAYDYGGQAFFCSQTITVGGAGGSANIYWPPDYTTHSCNPETDPEDLPAPYDYPVFDGGGTCSQLLYSHSDKVFNINPPACKKIVRTWTVIDWCVYDPNAYNPEGIWEYTQIIKIAPASPPVVGCPADTTVSAGADCTGGHVNLPNAYGTSDCGSGAIITNNSPYAYNHGPNASGNYPIGTTKVTFWADDGCGQKTSCSMYVTVKDLKKPTPICFYGISLPLMQMPDGMAMDLRPQIFDKGSFDNCTPRDKLHMWVEPARVDCDNLGATPVRLYVEDESGNVEFCNTLLYVQDNMGMCPPNVGNIDGVIQSTTGNMLGEVKVSLEGTMDFAMTNEEGLYAFPALRFGKTYTISPAYPDDDLAGVSALDMAILLKHILGVEKFSSPYQFIAADLDKSGRVSVSDLIGLKDLILKDYYGLDPKTAWRFVDASYVFQDANDPLSEDFPEAYHIQTFAENMSALDFVGVKLGDINSDASPNVQSNTNVLSRSSVSVHLSDRTFKKGETFDAIVSVTAFDNLEAMQLALDISDEMIEVVGIELLQQTQGLDVINRSGEHNMVTALWYGVEPLTSAQLFSIKVHALQNGHVAGAIQLTPTLHSLAYRKNVTLPFTMNLEFVEGMTDDEHPTAGTQANLKLAQNYPNPFADITNIPVELAEAGLLQIEVFDLDGRPLLLSTQIGIEGLQEVSVNAADLEAQGVVLCRITSGISTKTLRMVIRPGS